MKIHLLSGFLGSGKTTAIATAAVNLMKAGKRVGVITNDQGKYQVDSKFVNSKGVPVVEISNGCFCCNYDSLDKHIIALDETQSPDYIFAESVGSCTDIVATVLKPLQKYRKDVFSTISLSTFADSRMLLHFIKESKLPFSEDVNYIIEKQYQEADILVVNKLDLIDDTSRMFLKNELPRRFPNKKMLYQNSHMEKDIKHWVEFANDTLTTKMRESLDIDYTKYGQGEAQLGWLDQVINITGKHAIQTTQYLSNLIYKEFVEQSKLIGHLKFIITDGNQTWKESYTSFDSPNLFHKPIVSDSEKVELLINARIEAEHIEIKKSIDACIIKAQEAFNDDITTLNQDHFAPGFPTPVHQIR